MFAATFGTALAGSWLLLRRRFAGLRGSEAVVALGLLLVVGLLSVHLLPAMIGILGRGSVLVAAALWLAICMRVPARPGDELPIVAPSGHRRRASRLAAWLVVGLSGLFVVSFVLDQAWVPSTGTDYTNFHLPTTVAWIQSGTIWQVDNFLPDLAPGNYPNNGDALVLAFVLPWHNDFLAHLAIWPCYVLTGFATYALALRTGADRPSAMVAGALMLVIPAVAIAALAATITDSVMLFGFASGLLFLARHNRSGLTSDLVMAGLALGISFGTKWYAVYAVVIVVAVWAVARLWERRRLGETVRQAAVVTGLIALAGGVWLVRNWIISDNPAFPVEVDLLGLTIFDAPHDRIREAAGFTIMDYVGDWDAWWKIEGHPALRGATADGILLQWWHALAAPALLATVGALGSIGIVSTKAARPWSSVCRARECSLDHSCLYGDPLYRRWAGRPAPAGGRGLEIRRARTRDRAGPRRACRVDVRMGVDCLPRPRGRGGVARYLLGKPGRADQCRTQRL